MVSSDFGKLDVQRHFSSGIDWAMAGMATPVAAVATPVSPAALRNSRRFMGLLPKNLELSGNAARYRGVLLSRTAQSGNLLLDLGCAICALSSGESGHPPASSPTPQSSR